MKRLKRVTKREAKAMVKFIKELKEKEQKEASAVENAVPKKVRKVKPIFSLKKYLANKAQKRADKLLHRQEKREAKAHAGHKH